MADEEDNITVKRVLDGDRDLFGVLVRRYESALLRLAHSRIRNQAIAEELVQEAFLAAFKSLDSFQPKYQFRTWLWTILLHKTHQYAQAASRRAELLPAVASHQTVLDHCTNRETLPEDQLLREELDEQLHAFLNRLPDVQADALRLRFFGELPFQEIAEIMSCSLSSAKNRVRSGLLQLADWMSHPDADQSGDTP